ncbi:MAG: bifunctional DNA-formamidopyrimidine glycosylase/DNA-(apurinic or apyrimidinic site) lyase [Akkermansiaceae bacterium]
MPELPEVETTRRGIEPYIAGRSIKYVDVREPRMRWPVENSVYALEGCVINKIERRAKYILMRSPAGTLILHLGMSGSLRICSRDTEFKKHDHFILGLEGDMEMRLHDPRRFGAVLWHTHASEPLTSHALLKDLGPEPLDGNFDASYMAATCKNRKTSIKQHIMNSKVVVGVGNIYACEALFRAGIRPQRKAGKISKVRLIALVREIKLVLDEAIQQGGTTLRDFLREDGQPGYFKQQLLVYDRAGKPCRECASEIRKMVISNRSTFFCPSCQR